MSYFINAYSTVRERIPWFTKGNQAGPTHVRSLVEDDPNQPFIKDPSTDQDSAELHEHLRGFTGYAEEQGIERSGSYTTALHEVCNHIKNVRNHYVFERDGEMSFDDFFSWAEKANAILFMPNGVIVDAAGYDLLHPELAQFSVLPSIHTSLAYARRDRIRRSLWEEGVEVTPNLPPVISETEIVLQHPEQILRRAQTLALVGHAANAVLHADSFTLQHSAAKISNDSPEVLEADLCQNERAFVDAVRAANTHSSKGGQGVDASEGADGSEGGQPEYSEELKQEALQYQWTFLATEMLGWIISAVEADPFELALPQLEQLLPALRNASAATLALRPLPVICDALEFTHSMSWFSRNQSLGQNKNPKVHLNPMQQSILLERHRALEWATHPLVNYESVDMST